MNVIIPIVVAAVVFFTIGFVCHQIILSKAIEDILHKEKERLSFLDPEEYERDLYEQGFYDGILQVVDIFIHSRWM